MLQQHDRVPRLGRGKTYRQGSGNLQGIPLLLLVGLLLLASCSPFRQGEVIAYEVVAEGAPALPEGDEEARLSQPIAVALSGGSPQPALPPGLPVEALDVLEEALITVDEALYIVIYAGVQTTAGYGIEIIEMELRDDGEHQTLTVDYTIEGPAEGEAVAEVLTQPYVIARVMEVDVPADAVTFNGPWSP